jgi:hypothetical protein
MSRPLSSHEEIQCHGPRFQSTGKTGYHSERARLSVVAPCFGCQNEGGNLMPKVTFSVRRTSTRKDQCCPSFAGLPGFYFATALPIGCYHLTNGLPIQLVRGLG